MKFTTKVYGLFMTDTKALSAAITKIIGECTIEYTNIKAISFDIVIGVDNVTVDDAYHLGTCIGTAVADFKQLV